MPVATDPLILSLVRDESLTRDLGDVEARMLVEWAVDWGELLTEAARSEAEAKQLVQRLLRRSKAIARFVSLWFQPTGRKSALQLAAVERFEWPLPDGDADQTPADLMEHILNWESKQRV